MPNAPFLRENLTIFSISGPAALVCPTKTLWGPSFSPFCGCIALAALCALPHRAAGAALGRFGLQRCAAGLGAALGGGRTQRSTAVQGSRTPSPWSGGQECPEKAEVSTFVGEGTPVHDFARRSLFAVEPTAAPTSEESSYLHLKNEQN